MGVCMNLDFLDWCAGPVNKELIRKPQQLRHQGLTLTAEPVGVVPFAACEAASLLIPTPTWLPAAQRHLAHRSL
jgi:hypothetical protein